MGDGWREGKGGGGDGLPLTAEEPLIHSGIMTDEPTQSSF